MHCCYGNHILDTHWYGSLFAFADEMLRLGARPAGSLMGSKVVERIGKEERGEGRWREGERGGWKEGGRRRERLQEPDSLSGAPESCRLCLAEKDVPCGTE